MKWWPEVDFRGLEESRITELIDLVNFVLTTNSRRIIGSHSFLVVMSGEPESATGFCGFSSHHPVQVTFWITVKA